MTREETLAQLYSIVLPATGGAAAPGGSGAAPDTVAAVQQQILQVLHPVDAGSGQADTALRSKMSDQLSAITQQLDLLKSAQQAQADAVAQNTAALASSSKGAGAAIANTAKDIGSSFLSGFGLSPLVSGLMKLFGGGGSSQATETAIAKYVAPDSVQMDAGLTNGGTSLVPVTRGAGDQVRAIQMPQMATMSQAAPTQVTIQVNAMDSRSFLDRSDDIAKAVRLAMLESHPINDVVSEL